MKISIKFRFFLFLFYIKKKEINKKKVDVKIFIKSIYFYVNLLKKHFKN
jgi:hypothetical protein